MDSISALFLQNQTLILAAEDWAKQYRTDKESFAKLVAAEAQLNLNVVGYLKGLARRAPDYVDWPAYTQKLAELQAASDPFNVDVMVAEIPDNENGLIMQVVFDPIAVAVESGLTAAEAAYGITLPGDTISTFIDLKTKETVALLVGKSVDKFGNIVPAKNPKYEISEVTRKKIMDSVRISLGIGEDRDAATKRLQETIKDPKRAERIAATEAVNGYQGGQLAYAIETGAKEKEWQALPGACRLCTMNANEGPIPIQAKFATGHLRPSCHPWDRCGIRYVYQEEIDLRK